jgi:Lipopolysaccharide-assembly
MVPICLALLNLSLAPGASPDADVSREQKTTIHTVYVPIFKNRTFRRGLEFDLTRAVIREIEAKTPYKVVSDEASADAVLSGTILAQRPWKSSEEAELTVVVRWRSARTGKPLPFPGGEKKQPIAFVRQVISMSCSGSTRGDRAIACLAVKILSLLEEPR